MRRTWRAQGSRHRATTVTDRECDLAEYLATRNNLDNPAPWLRQVFEELGRAGSMDGSWEDNWRLGVGSALAHEADLLPIVFHLPWERERQERLLRRDFFESDVRRREASLLMPIHRPDADWRDYTPSTAIRTDLRNCSPRSRTSASRNSMRSSRSY